RRWHDVRQPRERAEDALGDHPAQRLEQQLLAHQRDAAANNDPPRAEQGNDVTDGLCETRPRHFQNIASPSILLRAGPCHLLGGDLLRFHPNEKGGGVALPTLCEATPFFLNRPPRRPLFENTNLKVPEGGFTPVHV